MKIRSVVQWFRSLNPARDDSGQAALVIITVVIIAAGVAISQTQLMNSRRGLEVTQAQRANFDRIQAAIEVYAIQDADFLLPCPATPGTGGAEVAHNGTGSNECSGGINRGIVPWSALGLSESDVIDAKGNYITYIVDSTDISACNGTNPGVDSLTDSNGGANAAYALIGHGGNGFGAFSSNGAFSQIAPTSASARELDNCPNNIADCTPSSTDGFRRGPSQTNTQDGTYFDDIVKTVSFADTFTVECPVINEDTTTVVGDNAISLTAREAATGMTGTTNDATLQTRTMSTTTDTSTDETITQIGFTGSTSAFASAACDWFESPIRFQDSVIRIYQEFGMLSDVSDVRGNGIVLALMSYDPASYRLSTTNRNFICGGTDGDMGFANDPVVANRELPDVPRMGIEIDTESHFDGASPVDPNTVNKDNALDHIAIVNGNVDHMGSRVTIDSSTHGDGPLCVDEVTPGAGDANPGTANGNTDLLGCTPRELEVGSNTGNPVQNDFHRLRVEVHYETDTDSVCSGLGFVSDYAYVAYWLYTSSSSGIPSCPENPGTCADLTQDYAETPTGRFCIPWSSAAGDEFVRYGLTTGAAAVTGGGRDEIRVQKIGVGSSRITAATFPTAAATARSGEVNNIVAADEYEAVVTALGANDGRLLSTDLNNTENTESGLIDLPSQGAKLVSGRGTLTVNYGNTNDGTPEELWDGEGIGVIGVGNVDNNAIGNYWERTVDNVAPTADLGVYLDADKGESLTVEFDQVYSRMTFNLGEFSDFTIPDGTDGVSGDQTDYERVIVRAYNSTSGTPDTPVYEETITACTANTGNGNHMTVSLDLTTTPADKITFIPQTSALLPSTSPVENQYGTEFWLRGIQACGMDAPCGVLADTDCFVYDGATVNTFPSSYPYGGMGAGSGVTADITIESAQTAAGGANYLRFEGNGETPWLYLEDSGVDIYANGVDVFLDEHNTAGQLAREGFSVDNTTISHALSESITFLFHNTWEEVALSIGKFGRVGGSGASLRAERVQVQGFRNGSAVTAVTTVAACHTDPAFGDSIISDNNNGSKSFNLDFNQAVDQIVITPTTTTPLATSSSQIVVRGIKGCDGTAACALGNINGAGNDCSGGTIVVPSL